MSLDVDLLNQNQTQKENKVHMADETKEPEVSDEQIPRVALTESYTLTRNEGKDDEVTKPLKQFKIIKGKKKDLVYLCPEVDFSTPEAWAEEVKFGGLGNIANNWQSFLKRAFQDMWLNNLNRVTGLVNIPAFLEEAKEFTSAGLKLADIVEKLEEAQSLLLDLVSALEATEAGEFTPEDRKKLIETKAYINLLKEQKEKRSRPRRADAEEASEAAVPVR